MKIEENKEDFKRIGTGSIENYYDIPEKKTAAKKNDSKTI